MYFTTYEIKKKKWSMSYSYLPLSKLFCPNLENWSFNLLLDMRDSLSINICVDFGVIE